jgi:hypothetical protein
MIENRNSELANVYNRSKQLYLLATCARYDTEAGFKCVNVRVWHRRRKFDTPCEINQVVPYDRRGQHDGCETRPTLGLLLNAYPKDQQDIPP